MKDWIAPHLAPDSIHQIKQDQAALVPLMKVSKVCPNNLMGADSQSFYHHCAPALYTDCLTDDFASFLTESGWNTGRTLQQVRRLHIIHADHLREPPYWDLMLGDNWDFLDNDGSCFNVKALLVENAKLGDLAKQLANVCPNHPVLPRLERVVMGGIRETVWTKYLPGYMLRCYNRDIPQLLIDLPTVRHYCQSTQVGPLSLPSGLLSVDSPLETFTHHVVPGHGPSPHVGGMPPIVIGAINRYYFSCNHILVSMDGIRPVESTQQVYGIMTLLLEMFHPRHLCTDRIEAYDPEAAAVTTVEFYDFFRHVRIHPPELRPEFPFYGVNHMELANRPAESLQTLQDSLDAYLEEHWRGRVILKNREDAPACAACDLDPKEQWKVQGAMKKDNPSSVYLSEDVLGDLI